MALVIDIGTHNLRIGYSGDDTPTVLAPSYYGICANGSRYYEEGALSFPREGAFDIKPIFLEGGKIDKEGLAGLLRWAVEDRLQTKCSSHPVLLVDSPCWSKEVKEEVISILFEALEIPALFLGRAPVLAAFASGKHTGLIVDIGASGVTVCPVFDGYLVKAACSTQRAIGGDVLTSQCRAMLEEANVYDYTIGVLPIEVSAKKVVDLAATPEFTHKPNPKITPSFRSFHQRKLLEDFKESIIQVAESEIVNESDVAMRPPKYYEFVAGYNRNFGFDRFRLGEVLFQPNKYAWNMENNGESLVVGLSDMIQRAVQACDVDLRPSVISSVLLCGGGSSIPGLSERLNSDQNRLPTFGRVRVQVPTSSNERRNASWIGGSILASLGSFQTLWLTKQEYQEHGPTYIERKSP